MALMSQGRLCALSRDPGPMPPSRSQVLGRQGGGKGKEGVQIKAPKPETLLPDLGVVHVSRSVVRLREAWLTPEVLEWHCFC